MPPEDSVSELQEDETLAIETVETAVDGWGREMEQFRARWETMKRGMQDLGCPVSGISKSVSPCRRVAGQRRRPVSPKHWRSNDYLIDLGDLEGLASVPEAAQKTGKPRELNIGGTAELKRFRDVTEFCHPLGPGVARDRRFFMEVGLLGARVSALVDSGASRTYVGARRGE